MRTANIQRGFSIVELAVVMLVVSILLSVALPAYQGFLQQQRRDDARQVLSLNAQRLQRCFTLEGVYNGSCVIRTDSEAGYYSVSSVLTPDTFTLTASPVAGTSQATDSTCQSFIVDQTGLRSATGSDPDLCW